MANVTLHPPGAVPAEPEDSPSRQIVRTARQVEHVEDALGRRLGFRKLSALEAMDLQEIAGAANTQNIGWMTYATMAFSVVEIDGEKVARPATKQQLRALVARLGDEGIDAIFAKIMPTTDAEADGDAEALGAEAGIAAAKN